MSRATAGIDVGKGQLDVSVDEGKVRRFANTTAGVAELVQWLGMSGEVLVICEATGGYELLVVDTLGQAGIPVHIAHPNQVRDFARACGYQAKTDRLDAVVLSRYGRVFQPPATLAQDADRSRLPELLGRRDQLVAQRTQEKNRLSQAGRAGARASIQRHIEWLDAEIQALEREYQALLRENVEFSRLLELYCSVPGVGPQTAATLIAWLPELGQWDSKALASLCGVAPWSRDSGQKRGYRATRGGRTRIKRVLYLASLAVSRSKKGLGACYHRLRERGKPGKVALVAIMRKLVQQLNAVARRGTPWQPDYQPVA